MHERHPLTRLTDLEFAMLLFLASEAMLFAGLFAAFVTFRLSFWTPLNLNGLHGLLSTVLLGCSSAAFLREKKWIGILFAISFLIFKFFIFLKFAALGNIPQSSNSWGIYYCISFLHLLHVLGGIFWLVRAPVSRAFLWYWGFVDLIWVALLIGFYAV